MEGRRFNGVYMETVILLCTQVKRCTYQSVTYFMHGSFMVEFNGEIRGYFIAPFGVLIDAARL